jgi:hypothetical protein
MFSSLSIGNTSLDRQFQSVFGQGECKMEIRKLDPSNPEDAARLKELEADDGLYHGDEFDHDNDEFDHDNDEGEEFDYEIEYDVDDDMNDPEHRLDYINKLNEQ